MNDLKPRSVPIDDLCEDPGNARRHDERNVATIARSLERFGQRRPLVVARGTWGGALYVIAGNGTLAAARSLEWPSVLVTEVPADWDADKARAYALADNRTAELATWDEDTLGVTLLELEAVGYAPEALGFDLTDLKDVNDLVPETVRVVVGGFNTTVTMDAFVTWNDGITAHTGEARADVEAEIGRRLGL